MTQGKNLSASEVNRGLMDFLAASPTPYHATENMAQLLENHGHQRVELGATAAIDHPSYWVKADSTIVAVNPGPKGTRSKTPHKKGIHIVGAHTDSPALKVKPDPIMTENQVLQLGVEIYGGVLLSPWFDRDLSLAGKVTYLNQEDQRKKALINFNRPIAVVPNLAIHLNRGVNDGKGINKQKEMPPLLAHLNDQNPLKQLEWEKLLIDQLKKDGHKKVKKILGHDLFFYDTQRPALVGLNQDYLASARLDNLLSCYVGLIAYLHSQRRGMTAFAAFDHEEVGSGSATGAEGPFLHHVLEQAVGGRSEYLRIAPHSMMVSTDNAHALHPNYPEKHDPYHGPAINGGPVLKVNANQRYATNCETGGLLTHLAHKHKIPFQKFVNRSNMGCGSTIGPISSKILGIATADIGVPTYAMHSIRETAGSNDSHALYRLLKAFYGDEVDWSE